MYLILAKDIYLAIKKVYKIKFINNKYKKKKR